jgi:hypothetical protein
MRYERKIMVKKKSRKKRVFRTERWKNGNRRVIRSSRGQFAKWHKSRTYRQVAYPRRRWRETATRQVQDRKHVDVYGTSMNSKGVKKHNRIGIFGKGKDLYNAVVMLHHGYVPRRPYQKVSAQELEDEPYEYLEGGDWIEGPEVESG